ncbi:MAG: N(6)-L-threonylcarbamoyladenine synthase Kae1 [Candidatus Aenigmarchaeota archaeon]|nr:N(6)-L-threonylcarbamoyladenine synthase Kae1 [Candidatus Aenigmarchaeota archaeon]
MLILGIESTAHTFGIGIFDGKILADARSVYKPLKGGIHPAEAAKHHENAKEEILAKALNEAGIGLSDLDLLAYAAGPGLPPCLRVGLDFVKKLRRETKKPVVAVNHPVAHIEIAKMLTKAKDPVVLYTSGGNTQVIGYASGRYRVFGETQDIAVGNAIDTFIRETVGGYPGGPAMEHLASKGRNYIELPYVVKGMDLSFSGILTAAMEKYKRGADISDLCFSFQETCYAMLTEVTERALAHSEKKEVLLTGGVAASERLQEMISIMCKERNASAFLCPKEYSGDNGIMIAVAGFLAYRSGHRTKKLDFDSKWRVDEAEIMWMEG